MKVLHVIPSVSPIDGGPSQALRPMVSSLAKAGIRVDVATTNKNGRDESKQEGVRYFYFPCQWPKRWTFSQPLSQWLKNHASDYDLLHVHALFSYPSFAACHSARQAKIPYLLRPLGTLGPWSMAYKRLRKKFYYQFLERPNLSAAKAIQATSRLEAQSLERLGFGAKTHVVPLGVNSLLIPPHRASSLSPAKILFLSRLHPTKALPLLFQSLVLLRKGGINPELTIAGGGDPAYRSQLEEELKHLGLTTQVKFLGFIEGETKARVLAEADIFVLPSYQESFGVAAAEAMAAGLPVVVSDQVGIAPDIQEYGAGIVVPCSPESLAEGLERLISNPSLCHQMGKQGEQLIREKFSWTKVTRQLIKLYEKIVAN